MSWKVRLVNSEGTTVCEAMLHRHDLPPFVTNIAQRVIDPDHPIMRARGTPRFALKTVLYRQDGGPLAVYRQAPEPV